MTFLPSFIPSHNWKHGQSDMRIIKKALSEMMPGISVFLGEEG
jgi:hypothetical protein